MFKRSVTVGMILGSIVGGYIPVLFGASFLSYSSLLWSGVGAIAGVYIAYKISQEF